MDHSRHTGHHHHHHHDHATQAPAAPEERDVHAGHSVALFRQKFWRSLLLTLPIVIYSEMIQHWLGFTPPGFPGSQYLPFVLSSIIFFDGGLVFLKSAWAELQARRPGMMTLISLAIMTAYAYSITTQFFLPGESFFWELATLVTIMLLGHWLEMAAISQAENALEALSKLLPDTAEKLVNGQPQSIPVSSLRIGDRVLIRPGARIPVDGKVVDGRSSVDEATITGESIPVPKSLHTAVIAGSGNQDGTLTVQVTQVGDDTVLAGIMRLVSEAQRSKSQAQVLADKAAFALTIMALVTSLATFGYWLVAYNPSFALERAVTVLIIACPHALGLAIPLVVSFSTTLAARNGLLIRRRLALETARSLDVVLFDKTGTLTTGEHEVTDIWAAKGLSTREVLRLAASLEHPSEHIVGKAIVKKAKHQRLRLTPVSQFSALPGLGVEGILKGTTTYRAVSARYLQENKVIVPTEISDALQKAARAGKTEVYLVKNKTVIGALALADALRDESKAAIQTLHAMGIQTAMITGDSEAVAAHVAKQLRLDQFFASVRPEDKAAAVQKLQTQSKIVAMVGDGINDAPALAQADIGIAIGAGTDVAIQSADIILVKNDPRDVTKIIALSKATYRKMIENLLWATGYNVIAIPLAAGVLFSQGIVLAPALGAVLMSASTIIVALNAQLLRRVRL